MALVDVMFQENLAKILAEDWEDDNRAVWEDGSPVQTKRIILVDDVYDLSEEFPAGTLRPVALKTSFREIDWIYRLRSNKISDFKGKIWDNWANEQGDIGKAYGYQVAKPVFGYDNQMDYVLEEGRKNPSSRRLNIELWNVDDLDEMELPPCVHNVQLLIKNNTGNLLLKQRSSDFVVAGNFNIVEYAILLIMICRHLGLEFGKIKHVRGDCHIYNKHLEQAEELMRREPLPAPKLWVNPEKTDFYSFTEDDFVLLDYEAHPQLRMEVAI